MTNIFAEVKQISEELGFCLSEQGLKVFSPIDGSHIATVEVANKGDLEKKIINCEKAFKTLRDIPAPIRGELIRILGDELRKNKHKLAKLVTFEVGKITSEAEGEVQEMIDICDYAVGLSRMIGGKTLPSERSMHEMEERWEPLGVVGVISAFNFPVAVWAWNAAIAIICGNTVLWKPSHITPVTALACKAIFNKALTRFNNETKLNLSPHIAELIIGEHGVGEAIVKSEKVALISATGSTAMGRNVAPRIAERFGKVILELGGNNPIVVTESADPKTAIPSIVFGAVGTAGQRCTSTRRLFIHESQYKEFFEKIKAAYQSIIDNNIGDPRKQGTLLGPLIHETAFNQMQAVLKQASSQGGKVYFGKRYNTDNKGFYVEPSLVEMGKQTDVVKSETFAPILYVMSYSNFDKVLDECNAVPQGLSAAIFTIDIKQAIEFKRNIVAGIVNVNIGTSGAEIGGAFGGEKETGGGRESGSDSWKQYMRRVTSTTYFGSSAPALAQGVKFEV